ncbi:hypothetical protein CERSUDRAFT_111606 [Gelatoporia subvermispora B]|uniref:IMD domain-containing protein n=1 Tax=Ceriporiopsis subvermispora (strain B) TaxID=914234 RepID=M2PW55_CERS8|nr:hypothetical protein CERSUDRAFT_111606 [Gelatoporia subvermispora B]
MPQPRSLRSQPLSPYRDMSSRPQSPTFTETTNASVLNFGPGGPEKIITRGDLRISVQAYEDLLNSCASYRSALLNMSDATAGFADAMGTCSRLKGPNYESGTRLQAASGLHHLMSNHYHVIAETLDKKFEKPMRQHLENYKTVVTERSAAYEKALREKSLLIRETEVSNRRRKGRNLQNFRETLLELQRMVDELEEMRVQHYQEIVEHEEEIWDFVQSKICLVVRSTMDVFDRFTAKASDPVIEPMLQCIPDPFDSYGPQPAEDQIFTILPPLSVIANAPSAAPSPLTASTPELDGSSDGKNSWTHTGGFFPEASAAWAEVSSPTTTLTSPVRSASPALTTSPPSGSSPTPALASPASTVTRRHSLPSASTSFAHQARKSESKLRSVLSVIDEGRARHNGDTEETVTRSVSESASLRSSSPTLNGRERHALPEQGMWNSFSFALGEGEHGGGNSEDITPRNSAVIRSPSYSSPSSGSTPHAERSRSPHSSQSDETATIPPSIPLTT